MKFKDYYKTLGVEKSASQEKIKSSYKKMAMKYHPDKNQDNKDAEEKFKDISEAYEVLSDTDKRAKYDSLGSSYKNFQNTGGSADQFDYSNWMNKNQASGGKTTFGDYVNSGGGISDFFEKIFGNTYKQQEQSVNSRTRAKKGQDYLTELELTLEEALKGTSRRVKVNEESIEITFKPGAFNNQELKISSKGYNGKNGGANGDLVITLKVKEQAGYELKDLDIYQDANIDLYTAILGGKLKVVSLGRTIDLNITAESQNGKILKLNGLGMPKYKKANENGNLFVKLNVVLPNQLSAKEVELFNDLKKISSTK